MKSLLGISGCEKDISGSDKPVAENCGNIIDGQAQVGYLQRWDMVVMVIGRPLEVISDKD